MKILQETRQGLARLIDRFVIRLYGMTKESMEKEIDEIFARPYYRAGMALYTFNGDSQRYWKLKRYISAL